MLTTVTEVANGVGLTQSHYQLPICGRVTGGHPACQNSYFSNPHSSVEMPLVQSGIMSNLWKNESDEQYPKVF